MAGFSIPAERFRTLLLWLTGASSAIVFIEPSPYELVSLLTMVTFALSGLTLSPALLPLGLLLVLINIGYSISAGSVIGEQGVVVWLLTSWYLAFSALFFAAMLGANTQARLDAITRGCVIAGIIASLVAIVGYFRLFPGANDLLLLYDRARGTFKDPNVLGAFLVFPTLLVLQRIITGTFKQAAKGAIVFGLLAVAMLLSFSRAAWGQVVYTTMVALALSFFTTRSETLRLRIVLLTIAGAAVLVMFIAALLSIDAIAVLFKERATLQQSYDVNEQGRFARHAMGAIFALDIPLGIGPLQFNKYFTEDPHNSYLNAFMAGGWLSGACYPALVALSLLLRPTLRARAHALAADHDHRLCGVFRRGDREHHHRQRPLAARLPAARPAVGADRRNPALCRAFERARARPAGCCEPRGPCALGAPGVEIFRRSVAQPG